MDTSESLFESIKRGDIETVRALVAQTPALASARDTNGLSAVLLAMYYQQPTIGRLLAENASELSIFEAAAVGDDPRARELLEEHPEKANAVAPDGFQPLGLAAFFGNTAVARMLIEYGAEVNAPSQNGQRVMPLHSAVAAQATDIVRLLIDNGADVNAVQADDFTPLQGAAQNGQREMVELLLIHGANKAAANRQGQTARDIALANNHSEVAGLL